MVSLDVSGISLSKSDIVAIGAIKSLRTSSMGCCRLSPGSLECIRELKELTDLDVSINQLSSSDTCLIGCIKSLVKLDISSCTTEPASLRHIRNSEHLMYLCAEQVKNNGKEAMQMLVAEGVYVVF